jgi:two-component system sensor histidine kinase UhpB
MAGVRLPENIETAVFRILQEATANIVQHSRANQASVRLTREPQHVILKVADNGCGIPASGPIGQSSRTGHLGLVGMRERATLLGGRFEIESDNGNGTIVTVTIPTGVSIHE